MNMFEAHRQTLQHAEPLAVSGRVNAVRGLTVSVSDFPAPVGAACRIERPGGAVEGRVIGFADADTLVMPLGNMAGICRGDRVVFTAAEQTVSVGEGLLGRILNGTLTPIDGRGKVAGEQRRPLWPEPIDPMSRQRIDRPMPIGVRTLDALLTVGRGQRMGIFSGSGVGKSVLLGMIGRHTSADVIVIALIGERGREVRDFIERELGPEGLKRAVVVVSTSDEPPLLRVQAGAAATAVAEYFRDQGRDVLLLMDSLTRLAAAQRQVGLVAGEPPTTGGYTPSVFNLLPQLLERGGRTAAGSITSFYTVLTENDDISDPLSDAVRSVTDGHILLSRELANRGHYPAIDVLQSVSRVMSDITDAAHRTAARGIKRVMAQYAEVAELVNINAYRAGTNPDYDLAIKAYPGIRGFLAQAIEERAGFQQSREQLEQLHQQILFEQRQATAETSLEIGEVTAR